MILGFVIFIRCIRPKDVLIILPNHANNHKSAIVLGKIYPPNQSDADINARLALVYID